MTMTNNAKLCPALHGVDSLCVAMSSRPRWRSTITHCKENKNNVFTSQRLNLSRLSTIPDKVNPVSVREPDTELLTGTA
jgi:hypothetical protein